jgi:hypothetical protein
MANALRVGDHLKRRLGANLASDVKSQPRSFAGVSDAV